MQTSLLKAKVVSTGLTVPSFLKLLENEGVHLSKESYYRKMRRESEFTRKEIAGIATVFGLTPEELFKIFFENN